MKRVGLILFLILSILFFVNLSFATVQCDGILDSEESSDPELYIDDTVPPTDWELWGTDNVTNNLYVNVDANTAGIVISLTGRANNNSIIIYIGVSTGMPPVPLTPGAVDFSSNRGWTGWWPRNVIVDTAQTDGQMVNFYGATWNTAPGGDPSILGTGAIHLRKVVSSSDDDDPGSGYSTATSSGSGQPAEWYIPFSILFPGGGPGVVPPYARVGFAAFVLGGDNWSGGDALYGRDSTLPHNWPQDPVNGGGSELQNAARINNFQWLELDPEGDGTPLAVTLSKFEALPYYLKKSKKLK